MSAPPSFLGLTRWEWEAAGIRFRLWARPVIGHGGREVVPYTLVWQRPDGQGGVARCGGLIEAMDRAACLASAAGG